MARTRGKAGPSTQTKLRLFTESAGYCQNPECQRKLFVDDDTEGLHLGEMAHIFAASDDGPRSKRCLSMKQRGYINNLVLLCPYCHALVDKCPEKYTAELILEWKERHEIKLSEIFGIKIYKDRSSLKESVDLIQRASKQIHAHYGPDAALTEGPDTELAEIWRRKVITDIIPNNKKIIMLLERNIGLLREDEKETLSLLRLHNDDLQRKHVFRDGLGRARKFPLSMSTMLND